MFGRKKAKSDDGEGFLTELGDVKALIVAYVKQETIDPIKSLGRYLAFGLLGSFLLAAGCVLLALAGLRALQTETGTTFAGNWSWAPYLIVFVGAIVVGGFTLTRIGAKK